MIELGVQSFAALVRRACNGGLSFAPLSDFNFKMRTGYFSRLLFFLALVFEKSVRVADLSAQGLPCDLQRVQIQ